MSDFIGDNYCDDENNQASCNYGGFFLWLLQVYWLLAHISALSSWLIDNYKCCLDPIICSKFLSAQILFWTCPKRFSSVQKDLEKSRALSFYLLFWIWPKWFGTDQNKLEPSKKILKWFGSIDYKTSDSVKSKDFSGLSFLSWTWPKWFGPDHNELDPSKMIVTHPKSFWTHRRTRHQYLS